MIAADLIARARRAGVELRPEAGGELLRVQGCPDADLADDLRTYELDVLEELEAERAREAAIDAAFRRVQEFHLEAGQPEAWRTSSFREAGEELDRLWRGPKTSTTFDRELRRALRVWQALAFQALMLADYHQPGEPHDAQTT